MNWHSIRSNHCVFLENMKGYSHLYHFDDGGLVAEFNMRGQNTIHTHTQLHTATKWEDNLPACPFSLKADKPTFYSCHAFR